MNRIAGFFNHWRWGIALVGFVAAGILAASLLLTVMDNIEGRRDAEAGRRAALHEAQVQREASARQVNELVKQGEANARLIGRLSEDIVILQAQVEALGGTPAVPPVAESSQAEPTQPSKPTPAPEPTPTPEPNPRPPAPTPTPDRPRPVPPFGPTLPIPCLPIVCPGGLR